MDTAQIISIVALVITLCIAIFNVLAARQLEHLKKRYDLMYIRYNKLTELKERISQIRSEGSVADFMKVAVLGNDDPKTTERAKQELVKILHGLEKQSAEMATLFLTYNHCFSASVREKIKGKAQELSDSEINFLQECGKRERGADLNDIAFPRMKHMAESINTFLRILDEEIEQVRLEIEGR
jgi:hypothetical protein